jgi:hypothetical protein
MVIPFSEVGVCAEIQRTGKLWGQKVRVLVLSRNPTISMFVARPDHGAHRVCPGLNRCPERLTRPLARPFQPSKSALVKFFAQLKTNSNKRSFWPLDSPGSSAPVGRATRLLHLETRPNSVHGYAPGGVDLSRNFSYSM